MTLVLVILVVNHYITAVRFVQLMSPFYLYIGSIVLVHKTLYNKDYRTYKTKASSTDFTLRFPAPLLRLWILTILWLWRWSCVCFQTLKRRRRIVRILRTAGLQRPGRAPTHLNKRKSGRRTSHLEDAALSRSHVRIEQGKFEVKQSHSLTDSLQWKLWRLDYSFFVWVKKKCLKADIWK